MSSSEQINLVLVHGENALDVEDFKKIAQRATIASNNIKTFIHTDSKPDEALLEELSQHPTFVFSPLQLKQFYVKRGCVYAGRPMQKSEQLLRLDLAGVPVPPWTTLDRGKIFNPQKWGDNVIVKPEIGSRAKGVKIHKTESLNNNSAKIKRFDRLGKNFIVQKLIYSKTCSKIRILLLFGEVLYAQKYGFKEEVKFDTDIDLANYERLFITDATQAEDYENEDVFSMAKRCANTFDGVPMLALDVMLDENEKPFFIEANPGGNTWHFSSAMIGRKLRQEGLRLEEQFDAFNKAGDILAQRALTEAV